MTKYNPLVRKNLRVFCCLNVEPQLACDSLKSFDAKGVPRVYGPRQDFNILILTLAGCIPDASSWRSMSGTSWRSLAAMDAFETSKHQPCSSIGPACIARPENFGRMCEMLLSWS